MNNAARITAIAATVLISACSNKEVIKPIYDSKTSSRHVAMMPYNNQGMTVAGSTNWYYGEGDGLDAFPAEGGIIYAQRKDKGDDLGSTRPSADAGGSETSGKAGKSGSNKGVHPKGEVTAGGSGRLTKKTPEENPSGLSDYNANSNTEFCSGGVGPDGTPRDMADAELVTRVHFHFNSTSKMYEASIKRLAELLSKKPETKKLHIIGHTDDRGTDAINNPIALGRANYIQQEVSAKWPGLEITTEGRGACPRIADNTTRKGRTLNRRAEIYAF